MRVRTIQGADDAKPGSGSASLTRKAVNQHLSVAREDTPRHTLNLVPGVISSEVKASGTKSRAPLHSAANDAFCILGEAPKIAGEAPALPITSRHLRTDYHAFSSSRPANDVIREEGVERRTVWGAHAPSRVATGASPVALVRRLNLCRTTGQKGIGEAPIPAREGACAPHFVIAEQTIPHRGLGSQDDGASRCDA
jgi:hypothetical protein